MTSLRFFGDHLGGSPRFDLLPHASGLAIPLRTLRGGDEE
jgi:hypothetical protein